LDKTGVVFINWHGYGVFANGIIWNKNGTIKKAKRSKKGYLFSNFYINGRSICKTFHSVIAEAFLGLRPEGYEVDHIDNVRHNNCLDNLRYLSKSENNRKSYQAGNRDIIGDKNPNSLYRKGLRDAIH
jgi:hypothetical protein